MINNKEFSRKWSRNIGIFKLNVKLSFMRVFCYITYIKYCSAMFPLKSPGDLEYWGTDWKESIAASSDVKSLVVQWFS